MYQRWCWSSGSSSASCLCFCSAFFLREPKSGSELENGDYAPPHREIYPRSLALLFDAAGPLHTTPRLSRILVGPQNRRLCATAQHGHAFLAPNRWRKRVSLIARAPLEKSPQSCTGEIQGIGSAFVHMTAPASRCGGYSSDLPNVGPSASRRYFRTLFGVIGEWQYATSPGWPTAVHCYRALRLTKMSALSLEALYWRLTLYNLALGEVATFFTGPRPLGHTFHYNDPTENISTKDRFLSVPPGAVAIMGRILHPRNKWLPSYRLVATV
ncbi:hypothetical protein V8E52_008562 [Russula decolorans]